MEELEQLLADASVSEQNRGYIGYVVVAAVAVAVGSFLEWKYKAVATAVALFKPPAQD